MQPILSQLMNTTKQQLQFQKSSHTRKKYSKRKNNYQFFFITKDLNMFYFIFRRDESR